MKHLIALFSLLVCIEINPLLADKKEALISTTQTYNIKTTPIYNQGEVLNVLKSYVRIPVLFPTLIKGELDKVYFAHTDTQINSNQSDPEKGYFITVSYDPDCSAHVCTLGTVQATSQGKLTPDYTFKPDAEKITNVEVPKVPVDLEKGIKGFYTPGYAAGSYNDPKIQWYYKDVLYTIQWKSGDQNDLIQMANSAILADLHKNK